MRHWSDEGASPLEQELLDVLRDGAPEPPDGAQAQIFSALSTQLGLGAAAGAGVAAGVGAGDAAGRTADTAVSTAKAAGAGHAGATAGTGVGAGAGSVGVVKLAMIGLVLGGATAGGAHLATTGFSEASAPAPTASSVAQSRELPDGKSARSERGALPPSVDPARRAGLPAGPSRRSASGAVESEVADPEAPAAGSSVARFGAESQGGQAPAAARRSQLEAERKALAGARRALQSGGAQRALRLLTEVNRRFPRLLLGQEHEALSIRALAASGARAQARARAERFVALYPDSPLTPGVREVLR